MGPSTPSRRHLVRWLVLRAAVFAAVGWALALLGPLEPHSGAFDQAVSALARPTEPRFPWRSVEGRHWQITSTVATPTAAIATPGAGCPSGMARVRGLFRVPPPGASLDLVEQLQDQACTAWISRDFPARCRTFDATRLAASLDALPRTPVDVCMDRFEYPNEPGAYPWILATFREAEAVCGRAGKRLCTETEWTFACEGEEARPYPYGWERDAEACVVDAPFRPWDASALAARASTRARDELDRLWQGEASGARPRCQSPFGVHDLTGNVDELTRSARPAGYRSIFKGGYWGPVRARCRPSTRVHDEDYAGYQQGFRCCADPDGDAPDGGAGLDAPDAAPAAPDEPAPAAPPADEPAPIDDEDQALARRGPGLACRPTVAPARLGTGSGLAPATLGLALLALARRRRRVLARPEKGPSRGADRIRTDV